MRTILSLLLGAALVNSTLRAQTNSPAPLGADYLRLHTETRGFMLGRPSKIQITPDGASVLFLRSASRNPTLKLYEFSIASGVTRELITPEQVLQGAEEKLSPEEKARRERMRVTARGFADYQLSEDGQLILLSLSGKLHVFNRQTGAVRALNTGAGTLLDPKFSPDGRSVSYVLNNDIHTLDLKANRECRVTFGGTELITHGLAEFVAQEEMSRYSGCWWSPDSRFIVYQEADATGVEVWRVADPVKPEAEPHASFYPRPGKANVKSRVGVIRARGGKTVWLQWDAEKYPYLAQVRWAENAFLTLLVQTRDQKELVLLKADPKTGKTTPLLTERDAAWVNLDQQVPKWLKDGSGFLWTSEREGGWQLELRSRDGTLLRTLVPPDAGYQGLVDASASNVIYRASADPTQSRAWQVSLSGGAPVALTSGIGSQHYIPSRKRSAHVIISMGPDSMPVAEVFRADGARVGVLPSVAEEPPFRPNAEILQTKGERSFYAEVVRPRNFIAGKRYPVIVDVYGGPHSTVVSHHLSTHLLQQWLADQGFILVSLDGRGTPGRGRDWERAIAHKFGSIPLEDQAAGLKALGETLPELDLSRAGIVGWSFGGYMSALAVLQRPDVYKAAVAGAPVTDWLDYDTHYTERYMGLVEEHSADYTASSLIEMAPKLSRPLLLVHGTTDDNVYFRHTLRLCDALFRAGKHFEVLPLSGFTHMVPDPVVTERLWTRIAEHFKKHLGSGPEN